MSEQQDTEVSCNCTKDEGRGNKRLMRNQQNVTDEVIELLIDKSIFFHSPEGVPFAIVSPELSHLAVKVGSSEFKDQVRLLAFHSLSINLKTAALKEISEFFKSYAKTSCPCKTPYMRYANIENAVHVCRGTKIGGIVKITSNGFKNLKKSEVNFYSPPGQKVLAKPQKGGGFKALRKMFPNISRDDFKLVMCWVICAINSKGPFPILVIQGEQGSAKTLFVKLLRDLIDPIVGSVITLPRNERDLVVIAQNNVVLAFDNVSVIKNDMPDSLCRLATGAGLRTRALFTDGDEKVFESCRPIILNGITNFILKSDLADRVLLVHLTTISENDRRSEAEVWNEYQELKPKILGSLYGAVSLVLKDLDSVVLESLPRMADFAKISCAAAPALRWSQDDFMAAYESNRDALSNILFSSDKVVEAIYDFILDVEEWEGGAAKLLRELESDIGNEELKRKKFWPGSASVLGTKIMQYAPLLRNKGVGHEYIKKNNARIHKFWLL